LEELEIRDLKFESVGEFLAEIKKEFGEENEESMKVGYYDLKLELRLHLDKGLRRD